MSLLGVHLIGSAYSQDIELDLTYPDNNSLIKTVEHSYSSISSWLINLSNVKSGNYKGLLEGVIGSLKNKSEQFDSHLSNTLFIFENIN